MAAKDVTDADVVRACIDAHTNPGPCSLDVLAASTAQPLKVCLRAMERAERRGFIGYGVSLRTAWAEDKGKALLGGES